MLLTAAKSRLVKAALPVLAAAATVAAYWFASASGLLFAALLVWLLAATIAQAAFAFASRRRPAPAGHLWLFRSVSAVYFVLLAAAGGVGMVHVLLTPDELRAERWELPAVVAVALAATLWERPSTAWPTRLWSRAVLSVWLFVDLVRVYIPPRPVVTLALPFNSAVVVQGGAGYLVNHHFGVPSQRYALISCCHGQPMLAKRAVWRAIPAPARQSSPAPPDECCASSPTAATSPWEGAMSITQPATTWLWS